MASTSAKVKAENLLIESIMSTAYWRINPVAMIAAAVALISVFLPWWGIYELFATSSFLLGRWALWNPPGATALRRIGHPMQVSAASVSQTFAYSSLIVLLLALIVASLALAGGLTLHRRYLVVGLGLSILTPIAYAISIAYVTSNYCLAVLNALCPSGPIGAASFAGTTLTWGFETGFYIFIVSIFVLVIALVLNDSLGRTTTMARAEISIPSK
jgi:hypothetical protein